jgi:hypothetical protein
MSCGRGGIPRNVHPTTHRNSVREPPRSAGHPLRRRHAPDTDHVRVGVRQQLRLQPPGPRDRVVVEEHDDLPVGGRHPGVAPPGQADSALVRHDAHAGWSGSLGRRPKLVVVVDDEQDLVRRRRLRRRGRQAGHEHAPATFGVGAHDDRGAGPEPRRASGLQEPSEVPDVYALWGKGTSSPGLGDRERIRTPPTDLDPMVGDVDVNGA